MWFFRKRRAKPGPAKQDILADNVRPKGVTRPLRSQQPPPASNAQVEHAVSLFLNAENWTVTYAVLKDEQQFLLTPEATSLLNTFIQQARSSGQTGAEYVAEYLTAHRNLLDRARQSGIEAAWAEFQLIRLSEGEATVVPEQSTRESIDVLRQFLSTENWDQTRQVLFAEQQHLLNEVTEHFLTALIHVAEQSDDANADEGRRYLEVHLALLRDARTRGVEAAWEQFNATLPSHSAHQPTTKQQESRPVTDESEIRAVSRAIRSLLTTTTWDDTRQILEREQRLLLTDTCEKLFSDLINATERDHDEHAARNLVYLKMHQRLLQIARKEGIAIAWSSFIEAMGIDAHPISSTPSFTEEPLTPLDIQMKSTREAVQSFLSASSWSAAHDILAAKREFLLTDIAIALITAQSDQLQAHGTERDLYATRLLNMQAQLLRRSREAGIEVAWQEFNEARQ